jgi:hypothetical protein
MKCCKAHIGADADARLTVLHEINTAITDLREREGKVPFDDGPPDELPTLFLMVRNMISGEGRENPATENSGQNRGRD